MASCITASQICRELCRTLPRLRSPIPHFLICFAWPTSAPETPCVRMADWLMASTLGWEHSRTEAWQKARIAPGKPQQVLLRNVMARLKYRESLAGRLCQILLDTLVAHLLASSRGKRPREIHRQNSFSGTGNVSVRAGGRSLFGGGFLSLAEF